MSLCSSESVVNILKKMNMIMKEVDRIEKDRENTHSRYRYASEKVIKEVLHQSFSNHGVVMQIATSNPRLINADAPTQTAPNAGKAICMALDVQYRFYDMESGEYLGGEVTGSGNGRDDKGIYAALTGAIKYLLTSNFLIPTGDDPEDNFFDKHLKKPRRDAPITVEPNSGEVCDTALRPAAVATPVTKPVAKSAAKPAAKKVVPATPTKDNVVIDDKSRNAIISNFDVLGIEIWDLEKKWGDNNKWTFGMKREMLYLFTVIQNQTVNYSVNDFLAGKDIP